MITYLFLQIEHFEHLVTDNAPLQSLLQDFTRLIAEEIQQHGGQIVKHLQRGVEAIFPPGNGEGIRCALAIMLRTQQQHWEDAGELRLQIGIHAGHGQGVDLQHLEAYQGQSTDFFGVDINRAAYLMQIGWGGQLLVSGQALNVCRLPPQATPRFLGRVPTKEQDVFLEVYQIDHPALPYHHFPALKVPGASSLDLPTDPLPFLGREKELAALSDLLRQPNHRLISIVGPGGAGKTRLAIQVAHELHTLYNDQVYFVPLSQAQPGGAIPALLEALHLHPYPRLDPQEQLLSFLRNRRALLILDNAEHLPDISNFLQELLPGTARLQVLCTSRARLGIHHEVVFPLQGFSPADYPDAIRLFVKKAQQTDPTFRPTPADRPYLEEIVRLLEGLPLGIQLAATAVPHHSPREIASRLREDLRTLPEVTAGLPDRQRSLRASFRYSWNLLSPEEQSSLQQLSLLADGFDLEAAYEIAGASPYLVRSLANKSLLVQNAAGRFSIPALIRPWLQEQGSTSPQQAQAVRKRRRNFYLERLGRLAGQLNTPNQEQAITLLAQDLPNLLALWEEGVTALPASQQAAQDLLSMAPTLFQFFRMQSRYRQGAHVFEQVLQPLHDAALPLSPPAQRLQIMSQLRYAFFLFRLGERDTARELAQRGQQLAQSRRLVDESAFAYLILSQIASADFDFPAAIHFARRALKGFRQLHHRQGEAECLANLGTIYLRQFDTESAETFLRQALEAYQALGDLDGQGRIFDDLGVIALQRSDLFAANDYFRRSLDIRQRLENHWATARILNNMAHIYQRQGDIPQARRLLEQSLALCRRIGDRHMTGVVLNNLAFLKSFYEHDMAAAKIDYLESIQQFLDFSPLNAAMVYTDLAIALCKRGPAEAHQEAHRYLSKAVQHLFREPINLQQPFQHVLFGWAVYFAARNRPQQAAELAACLLQQEHFRNRLRIDTGLRTYFDELQQWLESRLGHKAWVAIQSRPPSLETLMSRFQTAPPQE